MISGPKELAGRPARKGADQVLGAHINVQKIGLEFLVLGTRKKSGTPGSAAHTTKTACVLEDQTTSPFLRTNRR